LCSVSFISIFMATQKLCSAIREFINQSSFKKGRFATFVFYKSISTVLSTKQVISAFSISFRGIRN
jgi:hypothetical protein